MFLFKNKFKKLKDKIELIMYHDSALHNYFMNKFEEYNNYEKNISTDTYVNNFEEYKIKEEKDNLKFIKEFTEKLALENKQDLLDVIKNDLHELYNNLNDIRKKNPHSVYYDNPHRVYAIRRKNNYKNLFRFSFNFCADFENYFLGLEEDLDSFDPDSMTIQEKLSTEAIIMISPYKSRTDVVICEGKLKMLPDFIISDISNFLENPEFEDHYQSFDFTEVNYKNAGKYIRQNSFFKNIINCVNIKSDVTKRLFFHIETNSQDTLSFLRVFIPNQKFVNYRRWGLDDDFEQEAYKTVDDLSMPFRSDIEITDLLPNQESYEVGDYWDPTHLRIYKLEDFELLLNEHKGEYLHLSYEPYSLSYLDLSFWMSNKKFRL